MLPFYNYVFAANLHAAFFDCSLFTFTPFLLNCIVSFSGPTCERRIKNIPFKPLSERMMEEPFWLGLLAVFVVLGILGTGYMLKKHLPDKFDKLITEQGPDGTKTKKGRGGGGGGAANGHAGTL